MRLHNKNTYIIFIVLLFTTACATAEPTATVKSGGGPSIGQARAEKYNGPKARIAVKKFVNKAAKGGGDIGTGMADMMVTALFNTNRFIVLDRQDTTDIMDEQDLAASGRIKQETAAPIGEMEGAELLISGAITAFEPDISGGIGGVGVPLGGAFLGVGGKKKDAYMAVDIKVVDTRTGRIVSAVTVEGRASDYAGGVVGAIGGVPIPFILGGYKNTPMESAIRVVINKAVDYLASQTPAQFYRYK